MPVYGLPHSLEASLNSLVELRPPTSWRVSGHGNDVTVVLRWILCGSPSSDKTLDYDIDHRPKSKVGITTSHMWSRGLKRPKNHSPRDDVKTRCSSTYDCRVVPDNKSKSEGFQPLKLRKVETISQVLPSHSSPVPIYITVSDNVIQSDTAEAQAVHLPLTSDNIQVTNEFRDECNNHQQMSCDSRLENQLEASGDNLSSLNHSSIADIEMRDVIRTYLTPCCSDISSQRDTVLLDERSGLFRSHSEMDERVIERKDSSLQISEPTLGDHIQNDSGCASESNSTSLSHYVKHTLSIDSSSQDGSHYKSPDGSRKDDDQASSTDQRCSSAGSSISRSSFALQSCSSKTKVESFDSSNDNTNLVDEKDDECHSNDLDMNCSNEADNDQIEARSASSATSISYWESFDSFQSDQIAGEEEVSHETNRDITSASL